MLFRRAILWAGLLACFPLAQAEEAELEQLRGDASVSIFLSFKLVDCGQNNGTLFEITNKDGQILAGAGFVGSYNTQPRSDRRRIHFFVKQDDAPFQVEELARVNEQSGIYLWESGDSLYARSRNGVDSNFYRLDDSGKTWAVDPSVTDYTLPISGETLRCKSNTVTHGDKTILNATDGEAFREHYYGGTWPQGYLVMRVQAEKESEHSNRLSAWPWGWNGNGKEIDTEKVKSIVLRSHGEFVYAYGQLEDKILAATNTGGVYVFDGREWSVLVEPGPHSYQVYSMLNYYDVLLLGHYPTGEIYQYDGESLKHLPGWPPVLEGVSKNAREAQTLTIYGGDLYAGVWPWGEVWRYNRNDETWYFVQRMFSHPEITDVTTHPYEEETKATGAVLNLWGQRVTSMVPFNDSLYISTSSKGGAMFDSKFDFLADGRWKDYGKVYRLTRPGHLSVPIAWSEERIDIKFRITPGRMWIEQGGEILAEDKTIDTKAFSDFLSYEISKGEGVFGKSGISSSSAHIEAYPDLRSNLLKADLIEP